MSLSIPNPPQASAFSVSYYLLVLAAGASIRMGTPKALLRLKDTAPPGLPLVLQHFSRVTSQGMALPRVVLGFGAADILAELPALLPSAFINPAPERGQFSSLQWGLHGVLHEILHAHSTVSAPDSPTVRGIFVTPVDCPPVAPAVFHALMTTLEQSNTSTQPPFDAVIPTYRGQRGHPVLVSLAFARQVLEAPSTSTLARELERADRVELLEVPFPEILFNLNTPEDLQAYAGARERASDPSA